MRYIVIDMVHGCRSQEPCKRTGVVVFSGSIFWKGRGGMLFDPGSRGCTHQACRPRQSPHSAALEKGLYSLPGR